MIAWPITVAFIAALAFVAYLLKLRGEHNVYGVAETCRRLTEAQSQRLDGLTIKHGSQLNKLEERINAMELRVL